MAGSSKNDADWFEEFKKANQAAQAVPGSPTPPPGSPTAKGTERRKTPRFEIDDANAILYKEGLLSIFGVGKSNQAREALDLSEGGVRFQTHDRIPIGTKVRVVLHMEKFKDKIEATGEVKWCYQSTKNPRDFYAGIEFTDLEPAQQRKIAVMRDWFRSPQFKAARETKMRQKRSGLDDLQVR